MSVIVWIIFGFVVGLVAKIVMPGRDPGGFIVTTLKIPPHPERGTHVDYTGAALHTAEVPRTRAMVKRAA